MRKKYYRKTLSVPEDDEQVLAFVECQNNISLSLRALIKDYIDKEGIKDYFSSELEDYKDLKVFKEKKPKKKNENKNIKKEPKKEKVQDSGINVNTLDPMDAIKTMQGDSNSQSLQDMLDS